MVAQLCAASDRHRLHGIPHNREPSRASLPIRTWRLQGAIVLGSGAAPFWDPGFRPAPSDRLHASTHCTARRATGPMPQSSEPDGLLRGDSWIHIGHRWRSDRDRSLRGRRPSPVGRPRSPTWDSLVHRGHSPHTGRCPQSPALCSSRATKGAQPGRQQSLVDGEVFSGYAAPGSHEMDDEPFLPPHPNRGQHLSETQGNQQTPADLGHLIDTQSGIKRLYEA